MAIKPVLIDHRMDESGATPIIRLETADGRQFGPTFTSEAEAFAFLVYLSKDALSPDLLDEADLALHHRAFSRHWTKVTQ